MQKSFRSHSFVGLWFEPNLAKVEIELSVRIIRRRAVLCVCDMIKYDIHAKKFKFLGFVGL
jgi:hypothetical protein